MPTVYRVEHTETGRGPYRTPHERGCDCALCEMAGRLRLHHNVSRPRPALTAEAAKPFVFGCTTREKLDWWFAGFWDKLLLLGYIVLAYEVAAIVYEDD